MIISYVVQETLWLIMGVGTGVAAAAPIFLPIIKIGLNRKTKMNQRMKSLFSHATVLPKFIGVIFANRDICPQGIKD